MLEFFPDVAVADAPGLRWGVSIVVSQAISKVGRERRRRWLNDKILRDMAGSMTAAGAAHDSNPRMPRVCRPLCRGPVQMSEVGVKHGLNRKGRHDLKVAGLHLQT